MELLHVPALELGEDFQMGDEHSKKHGLLNSNFFFPKKKFSGKMLGLKMKLKSATCIFSPSFTGNLALKIYLEF